MTEKRQDGYHNLESLFYPLSFCDILEVVPVGDGESGDIQLSLSGIKVDGDERKNLIIRAYEELGKKFDLPSVHVFLHKVIPTGAGLGGGSSDAASMFKAMNELAALGLGCAELEDYAARVGSDCPFFIQSEPSIVRGRGERLCKAGVSLSGYYGMIFKPATGISTAEAYRHVALGYPKESYESFSGRPVSEWIGNLENAFEAYAVERIPEIGQIKKRLEDIGCLYVSMTGSGSAVFALFENTTDPPPELESFYLWSGLL